MDKRHILVVDDDENFLHSVQFILEAADYQVTTAGNGKEALQLIQAPEAFDLLITDIQMSCLAGPQLLDELNRLHITMPRIAITAFGNKRLEVELQNKGCHEYLEKPFDAEELIRCVNCLLQTTRRTVKTKEVTNHVSPQESRS